MSKIYKRLTIRAGEDTVIIDTRRFNLEDGISPEAQDWEATKMMVFRLAELEDKIENGTLVELPCKAGDRDEDSFIDGFNEGKKAVAQYYLDEAYLRIIDVKEHIDHAMKRLNDIAKEDGIKLGY